MHGIVTINKLNREAAEAAAIMKEKGFELPVIESTPEAKAPATHTYTPLPGTPANV